MNRERIEELHRAAQFRAVVDAGVPVVYLAGVRVAVYLAVDEASGELEFRVSMDVDEAEPEVLTGPGESVPVVMLVGGVKVWEEPEDNLSSTP